MNHKQIFRRLIEILLPIFLITACSTSSPTELTSTGMPSIPSAEAPSSSSTEHTLTAIPLIPTTPVPSSSPTARSSTATPTITSTEVPSSSLEICGASTFGTPPATALQVPSGEVITPENASQVVQLDYLGKGEEVGWGPIAFSPSGDLLASVHSEGSIKLYDMTTGNLWGEIISELGWIGSIAFSSDGKLIAVGGGEYNPKGIGVEIWDSATLEKKYVLENFDEPVLGLAFSPDGVLLATKDNNPWGCCYSIKLWNVETRELLADLPVMQDLADSKDFAVYDITFNSDGTLLAVTQSDGKIVLVDVASQKIVGKMTGVTGLGIGVAISPDGNLLAASGTENTDDITGDLLLWNLPTDELVFRLVAHDVKVESVGFNIDGTVLVSSNLLGCARLWDVRTGESLRVLNEAYVTNFIFSPNGALLATKGQDNLIRIWGVPAH